MRLNKYLARAGVASRRKADALIAAGKVRINGVVVAELGTQVKPDDVVSAEGRVVEPVEETVVYLMNKPAGVISAATDSRGRSTVIDLVRDRRRLFPVGRLDRDTTGALLIANDGELTNRLLHPRYGIAKEYMAEVRGRLNSTALTDLAEGMVLSDGLRVKAAVEPVERHGQRTTYRLILSEGQNREVKRIFAHFEIPLLRLHRSRFAGLSADSLAPGKSRRLRREEIKGLYRLAARERQAPHKQMDIPT
ncbi:MAG: pseudouridine synthase [Candidatus Neomarinimicrobiota bacterium]